MVIRYALLTILQMEIFRQRLVCHNTCFFFFSSQSFLFFFVTKDRRKGAEQNGLEFNVPDYLLPNQKDVQLSPLFATTSKTRVKVFYTFVSFSFLLWIHF